MTTPDGDVAAQAAGDRSQEVPLCVDLDGTLVRGDTLVEALMAMAKRRPMDLLKLPGWIADGRARLKREVAARVTLDPANLPYNPELLAFLKDERGKGRRLMLVTASDQGPAGAIADHVGLFDEVIGSDGDRNLKGRTKRDELVRRFGEGGFDYAGDSSADLEVWPAARQAIAVNSPSRVVQRLGPAAGKVLDPPRRSPLRAMLKAMRVHQWVKNLLIFLPVLLAHRFLEVPLLVASMLAFASFSLGCSAVYVVNDLLDIEADRLHPRKRRRPFAAGDLGIPHGLAMVPILLAASLTAAAFLPPSFLVVLLCYFVATTLYSFWLKQVVLVDVLMLAALYTVRIIGGSAATGVTVTEWLLAFSVFLFLSLGAIKRYGELRRLRGSGATREQVRGRGYFPTDIDLVAQAGLTAGYMAVLVLALYINSSSVIELYRYPSALWSMCFLMLYWVSRMWLLAQRGEIDDDPLSFAVRDRATWVIALIGGVVIVVSSRGF